MSLSNPFSRRVAVRSTVFGLLAVAVPRLVSAREIHGLPQGRTLPPDLPLRYPSIDDAIVSEVVGASHFDLDRVQELVDPRPELARATWDWGFGDWESALGAASHVGRSDIANYLIGKGARPNIFTFAMLGRFTAVRASVEAYPGVQTIAGPHGISLLQHARASLRFADELSATERGDRQRLIEYLEALGDADPQTPHIELTAADKEKYIGDYKYGEGERDGFSVQLNMRKLLSLGKLGQFGGALYQHAPGEFTYNGTSSVKITFQREGDRIVSLTVQEPDLVLTARKVGK